MYRSSIIRGLSLLAGLVLSFNTFSQESAAAILKKMDQTVFAIEDKTVNMRMVMQNLSSGKEKVKEAILMQKGPDRKLFRYTAPESDVGIATLSLPNNEIYVYLPMFKNPKKVTNLAESNLFNKSDFSIEDMSTQTYSEKFTPKLLKSDGDEYVLELTPKTDDASYSKLVVHIDKDQYYHTQFDYYDKNGDLARQARYKFSKVDGFWVANTVSMQDFQKNSKTTLFMTDIKVNQGLSDDLFALEKLAGDK